MYLRSEKKSKRTIFVLTSLAIIFLLNVVYLESEILKYKNIVKNYISLNKEYELIINENLDIIEDLNTALNEKNIKIKEYEEIFKKERIARLKVHVTTYNAVPEQTDGTPEITAYGRKSKPGVTFAASNDLIEKLNLKPGVKMYVPGIPSRAKDGMWIFEDKMHPRWKNRIDLMVKGKFQTSKKYVVYIFI